MQERKRLITAILVLVLIGAALSGCSMFKAQTRPNLTPFATHIIAMSENIQYGFSEEPVIWLNRYKDDPDLAPLLKEYWTSANVTRRILRGIVAYSIEVVTLAQSRATGAERAGALSNYLNELMGPAFEIEDADLHITKAEFDSIVVDIRGQNGLVDGLNSAQPVADEIARIVGEHIAQTELLLYQLNDAITAAINREHAPELEFSEVLKQTHNQALHSLDLILRSVGDDGSALEELWETDPILLRGFKRGKPLTADQQQVLVENALLRFKRIGEVRQSIAEELESYKEEVLELHRLTMEAQKAVRRARVTALAWAQAHRKLASGVTDPAKIDMMGITTKLLGGMI